MNDTDVTSEGARRAFLALNPTLSDADWESWLANTETHLGGQVASWATLAKLCDDCIQLKGNELDTPVAYQICRSAGRFSALSEVAAVVHAME